MTSLNTFGAIMTHAIELEGRLHDYYKAAGNADRAREADKRRHPPLLGLTHRGWQIRSVQSADHRQLST